METGLLHNHFGKFSTRGKKYYFHVEGSMQGGFNPSKVRWGGVCGGADRSKGQMADWSSKARQEQGSDGELGGDRRSGC